jgi:hypothetical protein
MEIPKEIHERFINLACDLSPENLSCDGEASQSYITQKIGRINREWKALEKQIGRTVTEDEVWAIDRLQMG